VKNRFQSLPFKCNLQRYTAALDWLARAEKLAPEVGGLYKLNSVDPWLESVGTQPLKAWAPNP
jgi:hypothetical protein